MTDPYADFNAGVTKARREYHTHPIAACLTDGCHNLTRKVPGYCCADHLHASRKATP